MLVIFLKLTKVSKLELFLKPKSNSPNSLIRLTCLSELASVLPIDSFKSLSQFFSFEMASLKKIFTKNYL